MAYHKSLAGLGWVSLIPSGTYPDPIHLAEIEAIDINITEEDADLEDASGDVIDSFTTKRVIEGTITLKDISGSLLAAATRGATVGAVTTGKLGYSQTMSVPGSSTYTCTVTNSATFTQDLGVINLTSGKALLCASAAADGSYSVSAGVYTFHSAQASASVLINYQTSATNHVATDIASATSAAGLYQLHCYQTIATKPWGLYVPAARLPGLGAKFAKSGWSDVTLKWKATRDANNKFFYFYSPE